MVTPCRGKRVNTMSPKHASKHVVTRHGQEHARELDAKTCHHRNNVGQKTSKTTLGLELFDGGRKASCAAAAADCGRCDGTLSQTAVSTLPFAHRMALPTNPRVPTRCGRDPCKSRPRRQSLLQGGTMSEGVPAKGPTAPLQKPPSRPWDLSLGQDAPRIQQ